MLAVVFVHDMAENTVLAGERGSSLSHPAVEQHRDTCMPSFVAGGFGECFGDDAERGECVVVGLGCHGAGSAVLECDRA